MKSKPTLYFSTMVVLSAAMLTGPAVAEDTPAATGAVPSQNSVCNPKEYARMQRQLEDWGDLQRYRSANATLPAASAGTERVVFFGDSITDAWGRAENTGSFFPGKDYINRGISGQTTPQMLVRFEQDVVHLHPAVVVILAGTNDIAGNTGPSTPQMIEDNYTAMSNLAQSNGIKVVLASITPAYRYPWKPSVDPVEEIRSVNSWIHNFCDAGACVYLDYYNAMSDAKGAMLPGYAKDGVHPTAKGYAIMAPLAQRAIEQALAGHIAQ